MSDDDLVVVCGRSDAFDHLPEKKRARIFALDGPFETAACHTCHALCLMGRSSRAMVASGKVKKWICTDCLMKVVHQLVADDEDDE